MKYSVRRLIGSLWAYTKAITITECFNGSCGAQGNCSKIPWKLSKKQRDQIRTRGKQIIFAPATWAGELSNFLVFILFWKNETIYLKNKNFLR